MVGANWLDRAIAQVAPRTAYRRIKARAAFEAMRGYSAASKGRRVTGWMPRDSSADTEIELAGPLLRARMRDLVRNNPFAARAVASLAANIVGSGIMPRANTGRDRTDRMVNQRFDDWSGACDSSGRLDFYGLQSLMIREIVEGGEVLVRRRWRRMSDGLPVPLQLQVLEGDFLDSDRTGVMVDARGWTVQGVEMDAIGRRVAYWLYDQHPGDSRGLIVQNWSSRRVPAAEVLHVYEMQRTQTRGVPWGAPVLRTLNDLDGYQDAELTRKRIEASVAAFVVVDDEDEAGIAPTVTDANGQVIEQFEPGIISYLRGSKDIKFNQPAASGGYGEYVRERLREVATGLRVPYELVTGDLSGVNYSSIRAGLVEFRRQVEAWQWQMMIPHALQPAWDWFTEAAAMADSRFPDRVPVEWTPPKFHWVDPQKDADAMVTAIRAGLMTWAEAVSMQGRNPDEVLAEIAAWNAKFDAAGVRLESDPRHGKVPSSVQGNPTPTQEGDANAGQE